MKMRTWIASLFLAGTAVAPAMAQMPGGPMRIAYDPVGPAMAPGMANPYAPPMYAVAPSAYQQPPPGMGAPASPYPDAAGVPLSAPPGYGYGDGMYTGEGQYAEGQGGYGEGCADCGGNCGPGGCGHPRIARWLRHFLPFDDGGCCAPHWFDVHVEYVNFRREDDSNVPYYSETVLGPIVLSSSDLDMDNGHGFRATVTHQVGPGSNLEFTYLGQIGFNSSASVTSNDNLFSAFSQFGSAPPPLIGIGFEDTDRASFASADYSSDFDSFELNYRQRFQGYGCKVQGSWLTGVRYIELSEDFTLSSVSQLNDTFSRYNVNTYNGLVGGQGGGDLWLCVIPGFSIGAEVKMGLFMNNAKQNTFFTSTTLETAPQVPLEESVEDDNDFTFVTEANFMANWRLTQSWTVRGGYSFLALNGVALATENFNAVPPFVVPPFVFPPRNPVVNTDGDLFMHGFTIGAEYMW